MKDFLTKKQKADLEKYGLQLMDGKDGTKWFGSDFDEGWIGNVVDLVSLDHTEDRKHADGMDFLVIGYKPTFNEDE